MGLTLLCGCVAPAAMPISLAASGPVEILRGNQGYTADLEPMPGGAVLAVSRDGISFGNSDGLEAKRVADQFCASRGSRVSPKAFGHYVSGSWVFKGGCA